MSKQLATLKEALKNYHDEHGWVCSPCRITGGVIDRGDSKLLEQYKSSSINNALEHTDRFKCSAKGLPANAIALQTGADSGILGVRLEAPLDKAAGQLKQRYGIEIMLHPYHQMSVDNPDGSRTYIVKWDDQLNNVDLKPHNTSSITFYGAGDLIPLPPSISANGENRVGYKWSVIEGSEPALIGLSEKTISVLSGKNTERIEKLKKAEAMLEGKLPTESLIAASVNRRDRGHGSELTLGPDIINRFIDENYSQLRSKPGAISWLLPGLWFRGMTWMVAGDPGVGKTLYLLDTLKKLSRGEPVFADSYLPTNKLKISYFVADASKIVSSSSNVSKLGMDWTNQENMQFISIHEINLLFYKATGQQLSIGDKNGMEILKNLVRRNNSDILVIDTLGGGLSREDENKPSEISPIMSAFRALAGELNILLILVHHFRKRGNDTKTKSAYRSLEDVAGSKSIYAQCDSVISIEKRFDDFGTPIDKSGIIRILKEGAAGGIKRFPEIHFDILNPDEEHACIEQKLPSEGQKTDSMINRILSEIYNTDKCTFKTLFNNLQIHLSSVRQLKHIILQQKTEGYIKSIGHTRRSYYELTNKGMEYIKSMQIETIIEQQEPVSEYDLQYRPELDLIEENEEYMIEAQAEKKRLLKEIEELTSWNLSRNTVPPFYKDEFRKSLQEFRDFDGFFDENDRKEFNETIAYNEDMMMRHHGETDYILSSLSAGYSVYTYKCNSRIEALCKKHS